MLTPEDVDLIQDAVRQLAKIKDLYVVDLGAGSGTTAGAVLAARARNLTGVTVDIDPVNLEWSRRFVTATWEWDRAGDWGDGPNKSGVKTPMWSFLANRETGITWKWTECDSVASSLITNTDPASIHLLMIDTAHTYEQTVLELHRWRSRMAKTHRVWLHDYVGDYPGVTQAVDEACARNELTLLEQKGLGALCRYAR